MPSNEIENQTQPSPIKSSFKIKENDMLLIKEIQKIYKNIDYFMETSIKSYMKIPSKLLSSQSICENKCLQRCILKDNDYKAYKQDLALCSNNCHKEIMEVVVKHQKNGNEISYFTFERQIKKCVSMKEEESSRLLSCFNYKINKLSLRYENYFSNQKRNLVERVYKVNNI